MTQPAHPPAPPASLVPRLIALPGEGRVAPPLPRARRVIELVASGFDEQLQQAGGDPYNGSSWMGLRVPPLPTVSLAPTGLSSNQFRYLFLLAAFSVPDRQHYKIRGYRQITTIGANAPTGGSPTAPRPVEQIVTTPFWRFPDGNVSWHLQRLGPPNGTTMPYQVMNGITPASPLESTAYRFVMGPAFLFESLVSPTPNYVDLTAYVPPNQGRPWGTALRAGNMATFYGNQTQYDTWGAWTALDIDVEGPDTIGFFASVAQTNQAGTNNPLAAPAVDAFYSGGLGPEEQFLLNFPTATYWRIGGSLVVETGIGE